MRENGRDFENSTFDMRENGREMAKLFINMRENGNNFSSYEGKWERNMREKGRET